MLHTNREVLGCLWVFAGQVQLSRWWSLVGGVANLWLLCCLCSHLQHRLASRRHGETVDA